jgi:tetratricopeptide (TPR) repeat protein
MDRTHLDRPRLAARWPLHLGFGLLLAFGVGVAGSAAARAEEEKPPRVPMSTARANEKGNDLVEENKFQEAADVYRDEALKRPENGILQRNLAGALARSQQMEEALASYSQALRFAETAGQRALALYDLGNTMALAGQIQPALEAYAEAMLLAPEDLDIKHNFEYLLQQAQQQQQGEGQQDPNQQQQQDQEGDQGENSEGQPQQGEQEQQQPDQQQQDQQQQDETQAEQQEQQVSQADPLDGMDPEDAQRLLDAMLEEEKELQAQLAKRQIKESKNVEKDW